MRRQQKVLVSIFCTPIIVLLSITLVACSSSNDGAVLPSVAQDDVAPLIKSTSPPELRESIVLSNAEFKLSFDELLNVSSVEEHIDLFSTKSRDIYSTLNFGDLTFEGFERDRRSIDISLSEGVFTKSETRVVGEFVDDEGETIKETEIRFLETPYTEVLIKPIPRLALNTFYTLNVGVEIRDISTIESASPVDGSSTNGNYFSGTAYEFVTFDGDWRAERLTEVDGINVGTVAKVDFSKSMYSGSVIWQQLVSDSFGVFKPQLFMQRYDASSQRFIDVGHRIDYIADSDGLGNANHEVSDFSVTRTGEACVAWVYLETISLQTIYLRCTDNNSGLTGRLNVASHSSSSPITSLEVVGLEDGRGILSYVIDGQHFLYALSSLGEGIPQITDSSVQGGGLIDVFEVSAAIDDNNERDLVNIFTSSYDSAFVESDRFGLLHTALQIDEEGLLSLNTRLVERGGSKYRDLSGGFDYLGRGLVGWLSGSGTESVFATSRYNLVSWETPIRLKKMQAGVVVEGTVFVFEDGQALFAWVESIAGVNSKLYTQGLFPVDGNSAFVRPAVIELDVSSTIQDLQLVGDREGNALLVYTNGNNSQSARFRQNVAWFDAWAEPLTLGTRGRDAPVLRALAIDGRMTLIDKRAVDEGVESVTLRIFSDFH